MKLHYMKKYNLDPDSLPHGEHMPGAVRFKEAESTKEMAVIANVSALVIMVILAVPAIMRCLSFFSDALGENMSDYAVELWVGSLLSLAILFPHEILHAICFKEDVYLYTNFKQGMLFVVGPETMSKGRVVFMSLLPNLVFGIIPYTLGMIFPQYGWLLGLGILATGMGAGDYYNIFNALTQMPKGARTYLYKFNSYWYMPDED